MVIDWLSRRRHWTQPLGVGLMVSGAIQLPVFLSDSRTHRSALYAAGFLVLGLGLYFWTRIHAKFARKNPVL